MVISRRTARAALLSAVAASVLLVTGCASQIAGLAPVGGDGVAKVRTAVTDVLIAKKYAILQAPACTSETSGYVCTGTLADGSQVGAQAPTDLSVVTITVAGEQIFSGSVSDVLESAAEGTMP